MQTRLHKNKFLSSLSRKTLLAGIAFFTVNMAFANSWYINDNMTLGDVFTTAVGNDLNAGTTASPFASFAQAISVAVAGDTIYADVGIYNEGDITISKSLVVRGAKFGVPAGPAAVPANRGIGETVITGGGGIYYGQSVDNITVDGFTINIGTNLRGIEARGLNSVIINNIITGIPNPITQQAGISTRANSPLRLHSYVIRNNHVTAVRSGFYMDGSLENPSQIDDNYAAGCITAGFTLTASEGHELKGNLAENNFRGILVTRGNNMIANNTIRNNTNCGVRLAGTVHLSGNLIQYNFIDGNGIGVLLSDPSAGAVNNEAHYNSFTGNTTNIENDHAASFNAKCNWFETIDSATISTTITGPGQVIFVPFLGDGIDSDPTAAGFQPITTCSILPVTLTSFSATVKNYDVLLNWQTSSEVNSSHFIIEKSSDNQSFIPAGRIEAQGFSDVKVNYHFTDNKPLWFDKPVYYRLAMFDKDGSKKYSKIIAVTLKSSASLLQTVYPNPVKAGNIVLADFISGTAQKINVSLVNASGQVMMKTTADVLKGANKIMINIPATLSGVHFIQFNSIGEAQRMQVYVY